MACQYFVNGNWISENQFKELLNNGLLDNLISDNKVDLKGFKTDSSKVLSKKTEVITRSTIPATKLASILADEIKNRAGYPINMLSALELNVVTKEDGTVDDDATDFKIPLWASPYASKFESLLTSLVSNKIVKQKLPGNSYVLGSEEGFKVKEGDDAAGVIKNSNVVFTDKFDATKGLQPLRWDPVNKKMLPAQIMIPFKFRNESGEILKLSEFTTKGPDGRIMLDMEKIPEKLLQLFGFRIPTQKQNSMAAVEIVGFLPETSGDLVLAPRDFTKQMGSDFDVDKLYTYMYNHFYKDGKLYTNFVKDATKIEKLLTIAKQQLEDLKEEYKLSQADRKLVDNYIKEKQEYNEKNEPIPSELAQKVSALIEESMTSAKGKGYPILDEFKNRIDEAVNTISVLNRSYKAARQNEILDIHLKVMLSKNPEVIAAILALDSSGEFKSLSEDIYKARIDAGKIDPVSTILSETYQRTKFINATAGKNGVGYFSLDSTFNASAQGKDLVIINLTPEMQEELFGTFTEPKTPTAAEILDANLPVAVFGESVSRGDLSNKYTIRSQAIIDQARMQGRALTSEEKASLKLKSLVIRSLQSSAVDNEKEQILDKLNINDQTFDAIRAMTILGFEEDEISGLLTQEIIWEFVETIKEARSSLSSFEADIETKIFMDLVKKYDPEGKYDKLDNASKLVFKSKSAEELLNNVFSSTQSLKVPADNLTTDYNLEQLATLEKFLELSSRGKEINQLQSTINSESKGVPKSLIETEAKVKQIRGINKGPIFNAGNLLGLTQNTTAGLAISPKTINGFAAVYGTMFANNVFEKYFPYKKTGFNTLIEEIAAHLPRQITTMRADAEFKQDVFRDIRSYLFANTDTNLFTENPDLERKRLFIDSKDNMSLAHKLSLLQGQAWFQRNGFLNKLDFDLNNNGQISRVNFEAATGENLDERNIYDGFIYLLDKNFKVGTFLVDGKRIEYTSRMLAQELVTAAFLEGGNQGSKQYLKYVPISYLKTLGFGEYLSGVPFDFVDTFFGNVSEYGVIYSQPSAFTRQFFQNNPGRAKTVTLNMLEGNIVAIPEGHFTLKQDLLGSNFVEGIDPVTGEPTVEQTKFLSIYDSKLPGKYALFEFDSLERVYRRIPTLAGSYGFVQYNSDSKNPTPTERVNRVAPSPAPQIPAPGYTIPNIPTKPTQTFTNGVVNNSTPVTGIKSLNISERLSGTKEAIDDLLNNLADSTSISSLNSHLIETLRSLQLPADFKVVYNNNISGRGSFNTGSNTLTINLSHPKNQSVDDLATVVTHELVHAHTSKAIQSYMEDPFSSTLPMAQFKSIRNLQILQNKYIENLVAQEGPERLNQFTELYSNWKTTQASFGTESNEAIAEYKKLQSFLKAGDLSKYYGAIKLTEFVTMALTDTGFQERLNNIKDEDGVSMWEKIKSAILEILNALGLDIQPGSALAYAIKDSMDLILANQEELKKNLIETKEFIEFGTKYRFEVDSSGNVTKAEFAQGDFSVFKPMNAANGQKKYEDLKSKPATATTGVIKTPTISTKPTAQVSTGVKPENISSKGSEFAKKLTNVGNTVGLTYKGKEYVNSEHAYQTWKSGEFNQAGYDLKGGKVRGGKIGDTFSIMTDILTEKLKQHPELIQGINERGGLAYIEQSTHNVIGDKFWESTGENKFIEALAKAYQNISTTQPSTQPTKVKVISEDYGVVQAETNPTEEKTQEFIDLIKPQIQAQTYKENKGRFANEMFHYGLMWARNNPKANPVKINKFEGANNNYYNYHALDQKGNALPSIKVLQPIIDEIQKSLGIDMSNYDSVIGNIYLDDQYVYPHKDTTESVTARNYPVVVYTIGNDSGLGIVDDNDGKMTFTNNYDTVYLPSGDKLKGYTNEVLTKNGSIYTFGMDGKGRFELTHSTPTNSKKTKPFPPITLPNGKVVTNYTITLTFRRAADLEPGMPTAPAKITTEPTVQSEFIPKYEIFPGVFANEGQTIALDKMANFLASNQEQFLLKGRGGTGKTTIVKMVMDKSGVPQNAILGTTVSDEARGILASNLPASIKTRTLASSLGLVPDYNTKTGELYFRERNAKEQADFDSRGKSDPIENAKLIIVDEVSMVGTDLYEVLMRKKRKDAKVIFMGDNAQIPPINADGKSQDSPVFNLLEGTDNFAELSERMRQGEESPILPVTDVFAENIEAIQRGEQGKQNPLINRSTSFDENTNSGVLFTDNRIDLVNGFVADFKNDPNNLRNAVIIGARNEVVDNFAKLVRDELFNNPTDPYVVGDIVRVNSPFMEGKEVKYANGFKGKVINVKSLGIDPLLNVEKFELKVEFEKMDIGGNMVKSTTTMVTISPEDKKTFKTMLNALAAKAKAKMIPWQTFYGLKESVVDLGYNYAMTSHKVQGSTYKNVYVIEDDIMNFPGGRLQQNRMMYTAVSRPTTKLVVYSAQNKPTVQGESFNTSKLTGLDLSQYSTPTVSTFGEEEGYVPPSEKDNSDYYDDWQAYQNMRNQSDEMLAESPINKDAIEKYLLICGK